VSLTCPACESRLSDDGKALEAKGALLVALEKKSAKYDKELAALLADIAELKKQLREKDGDPKKPKAEARPEPPAREPEPRGKPELPAGLSSFAKRKWREEHGS